MILVSINAYAAMAEYGGAISNDLDIKNLIIDKNNQCIKEKDMANITAVIEEPLDFGSLTQDGVRACVRISICTVAIEKGSKAKTECISMLNVAGDTNTVKNYKTALDKAAKETVPVVTKEATSTTLEETKQVPKYKITYNPVQVFVSKSGVDMLYLYIGAIYRWGASIIGVIAVLVIVISGIQISAAGGEQAAVTSAKTRITQSLIGIVVLFLSGIILYTINPTFFTAFTTQ